MSQANQTDPVTVVLCVAASLATVAVVSVLAMPKGVLEPNYGVWLFLLFPFLADRKSPPKKTLQQQQIQQLEALQHVTATEAISKREERESNRPDQDLHHGLGGMLSGIKFPRPG